MEENFYKDDFEKFLQEQANHHKMFPSDRIWRNINKNLHKDYKWPALTVAAFAFLAATIAVSIYFSPGPNIFAIATPSGIQTNQTNSTGTPLTSVINNNSQKNRIYLPINNEVRHDNSLQLEIIESVLSSAERQTNQVKSTEERSSEKISARTELSQQITVSNKITEPSIGLIGKPLIAGDIEEPVEQIAKESETKTSEIKPLDTEQHLSSASLMSPLKKPVKSKFSYQVYITPSVSYRRLTEDKSAVMQQAANVGGPVAINYVAGINQVVRHKPGTGMEAGVSFGYQLTNKLKVKTGLQLNARQYAIEAYRYSVEVATITYLSGGVMDSMTSYSSYRTSNGFTSTELTNRYYQVSIPVGAEYEALGNEKVQLNVAASLQPTYMLHRNVYLVSSDYKNYIESPGMTRNWNLNANIETYLSIKSGDFKWQLGPQLRYQTLPTSIKEYPIKEYLIDYGFKLGVIKNFR